MQAEFRVRPAGPDPAGDAWHPARAVVRALCPLSLCLFWLLADRAAADPPAPARVAAEVGAARARLRADDRGGALALLLAAGGMQPEAPERCWLLAGVRLALWQREQAQAEAARLPPGDLRAGLLAFLSEAAAPALRALDRSRRPPVPWSDLAAALLLERLGEGRRALGRARAALVSRPPPLVALEAHLLSARVLLEEGRLAEAEAEVARARPQDPGDARLPVLRGEVARRRGALHSALTAWLEALALAPGSAAQARRVADLLREPQAPPLDPGLGPWLADLAARAPANAELAALRGRVAIALGHAPEAEARYREALAGGAIAVPVERELRGLLAQRGAWAEALDLLARALPPGLATDPQNLLAAAWRTILAARAAAAAGRPVAGLALAHALIAVGALPEACAALDAEIGPAAAALRRRVEAHLAFEAALFERIEGGYRLAHAEQAPPSLDALLAALPGLAQAHLEPVDRAAFARPGWGRRDVPLLGAWLDHSTRTTSPVVRHFRAFGRYLMLGQRAGQPPEAIVLSLGFLAAAAEFHHLGRPVRHDLAVGHDRAARAFVSAQGGDLGGACLPDGIWLDADSARRADGAARGALRRDPALKAAMEAWRAPEGPGREGVLTLGDPGPLALRLMHRALTARGADPWAFFETLRAHEQAHTADLHRHLPLLPRLPATLLLLATAGFAPARVEMELERRAQLGAVADAPDPHLALAELIEFLPVEERAPEAHAGGYRQALRDLVRYVHAHPHRFPEVDRRRRILPQLERVAPEALRQAARRLAGPGRIEAW